MSWNVEAAAPSIFGEGKDKGLVLMSAGTKQAVWTDAGLVDFGYGTLKNRPKLVKLALEVLFKRGMKRECFFNHGLEDSIFNLPFLCIL